MHKYIILFFLVLTLLCSCGSDENVPDGILGKDEMTDVLTDIHIADGSLSNISQMPDTLYKYGTPRYLAIFKKYHTDSAQFRKSFKFYTLKPLMFNDMYVKILKKLQTKTDSLTKLLAIQNKSKRPVTNTTGGRMGMGKAGPTSLPTSVRPNMALNPGQLAIIKFNAKRDSVLKQRLKEKNALPKK